MTDDKITLPSGSGGLVRYFDEYKSKLSISPLTIVILIALVIIMEIILHKFY